MTRSRRITAAVLAGGCAVALGGCESSQTLSARLASEAKSVGPAQQGLTVTTPSTALTAADSTVLFDQNGGAVVVELKNAGATDARAVPVQLKLSDPDGLEVFTNATPGIQRSLTHAAIVPAGGSAWWVNDQIPITTKPGEVVVTVGDPAPTSPQPQVVHFKASTPRLDQDPINGTVATGYVEHDSDTEQRRVLISVIARSGDQVVAAGRGVVALVKPGKRARFKAFFIGKPEGAELTATAEPSLDTE